MKFSGKIGFYLKDEEVRPGIWKEKIEERPYAGDLLEDRRRFNYTSEQQNAQFTVQNRISILADLYTRTHWPAIRYVIWNDVKWDVSAVKVEYPRIIITLGGYYHGKEADT